MAKKYYIKCVENQKYLGRLFEDTVGLMFDQDKPDNYYCYWYAQREAAQMIAEGLERDYNITCEIEERIIK